MIINYQQDPDWHWLYIDEIQYKAKFRLKVDDNNSSDHIATLEIVCIQDGNETILNSKNIIANEFQNPNSYQYFDLNFTLPGTGSKYGDYQQKESTTEYPGPFMDYRVEWTGNGKLWVDCVEIYDFMSEPLLSGVHDNAIEDDINTYSSAPALSLWYIRDEPAEDNLPTAKYINNILLNSYQTSYTEIAGYVEGFWTNEALSYEIYLDEYEHYLDPDEYIVDHLTYRYQDWLAPKLDDLFHTLNVVRSKSVSAGKNFWGVVLTFGWNDDDIIRMKNQGKLPSNWTLDQIKYSMETRMKASASNYLAYGAKGIMYWNITPGLYRWYCSTTKTYAWYWAKEINEKIQSVSNHLLNLTSTCAFTTTFGDIPAGSFITDVCEDSIVVGNFIHNTTNEKYFMLVNPRWYDGGTKTFDVTLSCDEQEKLVEDIFATLEPWNGDPNYVAYRLIEPTPDGEYTFTVNIEPGEGRLFRITSGLEGAITRDSYWSGEVLVSNDLTVGNGVTLTIEPGTLIRFELEKRITVHGNLIAEGTEELPIVFNVISEGDYWDGIVLENSTTDSFSFKYCEIKNTDIGILANSRESNGIIENCKIGQSTVGIAIWGCGKNITIRNCELYDNGYMGISLCNSQGSVIMNNIIRGKMLGLFATSHSIATIKKNSIFQNKHGIQASYGSDLFIALPNADIENCESNNWITNNTTCGISAYDESFPMIGFYDDQGQQKSEYGLNRIYYNPVDIGNYNRSGEPIYAQVNYWKWDKFNPCDGGYPGNLEGDVIWKPAMPLPGIEPEPPGPLRQAMEQELSGNYENAKFIYENIVSISPNSSYVIPALNGIARCLLMMEQEDQIVNEMENISMQNSGKLASKYALDHILPSRIKNKDYSTALSLVDTLLQLFEGTQREALYVFEQGSIYEQMSQNGGLGKSSQIAESCYERVYDEYSDSPISFLTAIKLGKEPPERKAEYVEVVPDKFSLNPIYPNPFNPETTIPFELPENFKVIMEVYNIMGRIVATLINDKLTCGYHSVIWNGRNDNGEPVASGLYIIKLNAISTDSGRHFKSAQKRLLVR